MSIPLDTPRAGIPTDAFLGLRALNVQSYTESNIKNGLEFEFSNYNASLAAGATQYLRFVTAEKPVIIKARNIAFTDVGITARVYKAPTISGVWTERTDVFNLRTDGLGVAKTVKLYVGGVVDNVGTEIAAPTYGIGSTGQGQTVFSTFSVQGQERILAANTDHLLAITNNSANPIRVATYLTWYEGATDLPRSAD